jgi:hypothetical protein
VPTEDSRQALSFRQKRVINSLDEVAKGLAAGTISRGRAIKLTGSALLGSVGLLSLFPAAAEAQVTTQGVCKDKPAISNRRCPGLRKSRCGACEGCQCGETVGGNKRCLDFSRKDCPKRDECDANSDCRRDEVCVQVGACCPEHPRRNLCVPVCRAENCPPPPPPPPSPPSPPPPSLPPPP